MVGGKMGIEMLAGTMRLARDGIAAGDWENGWSDNFFAWGGGTMSHPPVLLIEA